MALQLLFKSLKVDVQAGVARGRFSWDALSDLPDMGAAASWVEDLGSNAIGGDWSVADVQVRPSVQNEADIVARIPGLTWTWHDASGDPLAPVATQGQYQMFPTTRVNGDGDVVLTYLHVWSNYPTAAEVEIGDGDPLTDTLKTWEIEFVSTTEYDAWLNQANGVWPTGLTPPSGTSSGLYWCKDMDIETVKYVDKSDGSVQTAYRHFAAFWQAPVVSSTQMTWVYPTW